MTVYVHTRRAPRAQFFFFDLRVGVVKAKASGEDQGTILIFIPVNIEGWLRVWPGDPRRGWPYTCTQGVGAVFVWSCVSPLYQLEKNCADKGCGLHAEAKTRISSQP